MKPRRLFALIALILLFPWSSTQSQIADVISITVEEVGFGGLYRPDKWTPLRVTITNRGDDFTGRLVVRPETSTSGIDHTFSARITDLSRPIPPNDTTTETIFLYVVATGGDAELRVELLDENERVAASQDIVMRDMLARDALYVVVPRENRSDLSRVRSDGYTAYQVGWTLDNIPTQAGALEAVDVMVFSDIDTTQMSLEQVAALRNWVYQGGHLIVTGGDNQAETAAGLTDLLPFSPEGSDTTDALDGFAQLGGDYSGDLDGDTLITTGTVNDGARVLARNADDLPLVVRHEMGNGTVDYMTVSPNLTPLVSYPDMGGVWLTLLTSTQAQPSWTMGFSEFSRAQTAVEILPGVDLLPAALSLIAFLGIYVLLVGPLNYIILARLNRLAYAWISIPILIGLFSFLAYSVGFELRGNIVTLSRLSVVQVWPEAQSAQVDQVVGLLAPRRGDYTLALNDDRMMRPLGEDDDLLSLSSRTANIEISQYTDFRAVDFPVDASFIAAFTTNGVLDDAPEINGEVTVRTSEDGAVNLRGFIRNNTGLTLREPTLLSSSVVYRLGGMLEDGITDFDTADIARLQIEPSVPSVLEYERGGGRISVIDVSRRSSRPIHTFITNVEAITGFTGDLSGVNATINLEEDDPRFAEELRRRDAFLRSFMNDQYNSTGRGNRVFLVGWVDDVPFDEEVVDEQTDSVNTTLYIVELATERTTLDGDPVITQEQFTWFALERDGFVDAGPVNMEGLDNARLAFRFTPLPGSVLSEVESLTLILDRGRSSSISGTLQLWNWQTERWEDFEFDSSERQVVPNPARYIGPLNAVQMRTLPREDGGTAFLSRIGIEQSGTP